MIDKLHTSAQAVRTEISSVRVAVDTSQLTTVMGPACLKAGKLGEAELHQFIASDEGLVNAMEGFGDDSQVQVMTAVGSLLDRYATRISRAVFAAEFNEWESIFKSKVSSRLGFSISHVEGMLDSLGDIKHYVARLQSLSNNSGPSELVLIEYNRNLDFVCSVAKQLIMYDANIETMSQHIGSLMFSTDAGAREEVKAQQDLRESMTKERKVITGLSQT